MRKAHFESRMQEGFTFAKSGWHARARDFGRSSFSRLCWPIESGRRSMVCRFNRNADGVCLQIRSHSSEAANPLYTLS